MSIIKKIICAFICFIFLILIISYLVIRYQENKVAKEINNELTDFYNNGIINEHIPEYANNWYSYYVKSNVRNRYNITNLLNDYIDKVEECIEVKISDGKKKLKDYTFEYRELGSDTHILINIHGLKDFEVECILNNITEKDIELYKNKEFDNYIRNKLSDIFEYKNNSWFLDSYEDKIFELPYNVYLDYKSNKDEPLNEVKEIKNIKISPRDIKRINSDKKEWIAFNVEYVNNFNENKQRIVHLYKNIIGEQYFFDISFLDILFTKKSREPNANIEMGQHDYDEAMKREMDELDALTAERAKLGLEQTPMFNWDDYDEDGNYIGADETVNKAEAEEIIKYLNEHGITGIKPSDIKKSQNNDAIENNNSEYDNLTDEEQEDIDSNLRIQREMIEDLKRRAKESLNESK